MCRLAQLIPKQSALGVLRLPANEPRPSRQEGFVDDLHPLVTFFTLTRTDFKGREESGIDQLPEHTPRCFLIVKDRKELLPIAGGTGPLRRHQIAENLPHDGQPILTNLLQRGFGVLR
jgi:hypothetical protein